VATRLTVRVPGDYVLARDVCSYGYFLLAPNRWDPATLTFSRVLDLSEGPALIRIRQEGARHAPARGGDGDDDGVPPGRPGAPLIVMASRGLTRAEQREARRQIGRMLRLDEGEEVIAEFHRVDPRWKKSGRGRLMRSPTFFEDVIKTVTSCNVTWPSTIIMNARLCAVYGRGNREIGRGFPSAKRIAGVKPGRLRARCTVGYRDQRIVELAKMFAAGPRRGGIDVEWFEDPSTPDEAIHAALLQWPGIGPYAAANIMQLLGRYRRLPLDTESIRHGKTILGMTGSDRAIMKAIHAHFAPFGEHAFRSYWFELWDFYEAKRGRSWTWDRETTGRSFTAAKL